MAESTLKMQVMPQIKKHLWALLFAIGVVAPVFWMLIDRDPPYQILSGSVVPEHPVQGQTITVKWEIKPLRNCKASPYSLVTRKIVDSKGVIHTYDPVQSVYGTAAQFSEEEIHRSIRLPENITGHAKYSSIACYPCNPIQILWPICIETPVIEFDIEEK